MKLTEEAKKIIEEFIASYRSHCTELDHSKSRQHKMLLRILTENEEIKQHVKDLLIESEEFVLDVIEQRLNDCIGSVVFSTHLRLVNSALTELILISDDTIVTTTSDLLEFDGTVPHLTHYLERIKNDDNFSLSGLCLKDILEYAKNLEDELTRIKSQS